MPLLPIPDKVNDEIVDERIKGVYSKNEYNMEWSDEDKNVIDRLDALVYGQRFYKRWHQYFSNEEYEKDIKDKETKLTQYKAEYKLINPNNVDLYWGKEPSTWLRDYKKDHTEEEYNYLTKLFNDMKYLFNEIKNVKEGYEYLKNYTPKKEIQYFYYYNDKEYETFLQSIKDKTKNFEPLLNAVINYKKALDISNASRKNPRRGCYLTIKFYSSTDIDINISWRIYKNDSVFCYTEKINNDG